MSFSDFLKEKQFLENVSTNTMRWYKHALKWLPNENPDERALKQMVIRMREKGLNPTGANAAIRAINCYLRWSGSPHTVKFLKEPVQVMPTFTPEQVRLLVRYKPRTSFQRRLHLLIMMLLDTGARVSEALGVQPADIDMDNMLIRFHGKGGKDRVVPFSFQLRKLLVKAEVPFLTSSGRPWSRIGVLRAVKLHCQRLGFEPPARTCHAARHSFAIGYLRNGGNVFYLQRQLGHSSLAMTKRYANVLVDDLSKVHNRLSLLSAEL